MAFTKNIRLLLYTGCRSAYIIIIAMRTFPRSLRIRRCVRVMFTVTTSDIEFGVVREYILNHQNNMDRKLFEIQTTQLRGIPDVCGTKPLLHPIDTLGKVQGTIGRPIERRISMLNATFADKRDTNTTVGDPFLFRD